MKVYIDKEICAGFRACIGVCPEMFAMHDDGYATVLHSEVPPEFEDLVRAAASQCPSDAISVSEDTE